MKRTLAVTALVVAVLAATAWPSSAKGEGPVGARITGPGIGPGGGSSGGGSSGGGSSGGGGNGTIVLFSKRGLASFGNEALWRLATFSGLVQECGTCASYIDTSAPKDRAALGPVYRVTYYPGTCCEHAVRQLLYPYAPGGPVAYTTDDVGTRLFLVQHYVGWWHAEGRMGQLFLRMLRHAGLPATAPIAVAPVAGSAASTSAASNTAPWRLPLALGVMALLLIVGAVAARPRSPGHAA